MDPIVELLTSYADLNASYILELKTEPSPLEFMRFVALNTPFVVKNATLGWRATKLWSCSYFRNVLKGQMVNIAVTPFGYDF
jgi:jumonji domain-containing protein 7